MPILLTAEFVIDISEPGRAVTAKGFWLLADSAALEQDYFPPESAVLYSG